MKKLIAVLLALVCVLGSSGCNATPSSVDKLSEAENTIGEANPKIVTADAVTPIALEDNWLMPLDLFIDSGNIENNTGLSVSKKLNKDNGKYVGLYVENKGSGPVVATINGRSEETFEKGESGHIYVEVTQGRFGADKEYEFKVVPGTNGGMINIHYEIAQRESR